MGGSAVSVNLSDPPRPRSPATAGAQPPLAWTWVAAYNVAKALQPRTGSSPLASPTVNADRESQPAFWYNQRLFNARMLHDFLDHLRNKTCDKSASRTAQINGLLLEITGDHG